MRILAPCVLGVLLCSAISVRAQSSAATGEAQNGVASQPSAAPTPPVTPPLADSKTLELVKSVRASYPYEAITNQMQGAVKVKLLVNEAGDVEDAQAVEGDDVFRKSAVDAAKKWKFKPFIKNGKPIKVATIINMEFAFTGQTKDTKDPDAVATQGPVPASNVSGKSYPGAADLPRRVRVAKGVTEGMLLHKVQPVYPPEARARHIQGIVVLRAVIAKDGEIRDLKLVSGPPELVQSAMGAVRQWRYRPYYLMGEPVEVDTEITVNYALR